MLYLSLEWLGFNLNIHPKVYCRNFTSNVLWIFQENISRKSHRVTWGKTPTLRTHLYICVGGGVFRNTSAEYQEYRKTYKQHHRVTWGETPTRRTHPYICVTNQRNSLRCVCVCVCVGGGGGQFAIIHNSIYDVVCRGNVEFAAFPVMTFWWCRWHSEFTRALIQYKDVILPE